MSPAGLREIAFLALDTCLVSRICDLSHNRPELRVAVKTERTAVLNRVYSQASLGACELIEKVFLGLFLWFLTLSS